MSIENLNALAQVQLEKETAIMVSYFTAKAEMAVKLRDTAHKEWALECGAAATAARSAIINYGDALFEGQAWHAQFLKP